MTLRDLLIWGRTTCFGSEKSWIQIPGKPFSCTQTLLGGGGMVGLDYRSFNFIMESKGIERREGGGGSCWCSPCTIVKVLCVSVDPQS